MRSLLFFAPIALVGCVDSQGNYPSLLPRASESASFVEPIRPVATVSPDPKLDSAISQKIAELDRISQSFVQGAQQAEAKIAVARGTVEGSPSWLDAYAAMATLDALRAPLLEILTDLEALAIARGAAGAPPYPALDAAIARADMLNKTQETRAKALESALASI